MLRFHLPLIEPDVRISRIRLSDKDSRFRPREVARPQHAARPGPARRAGTRRGTVSIPGPRTLCFRRNHRRSRWQACAGRRPGTAWRHRPEAEVVRPAHQHPVEPSPPAPRRPASSHRRSVNSLISAGRSPDLLRRRSRPDVGTVPSAASSTGRSCSPESRTSPPAPDTARVFASFTVSFSLRHHAPHRGHRLVGGAATADHEVIRIVDDLGVATAARAPAPSSPARTAACRGSPATARAGAPCGRAPALVLVAGRPLRAPPLVGLFHRRLQPHLDQPQQVPIADATRHATSSARRAGCCRSSRDKSASTTSVCPDAHQPVDLPDGVQRTAVRPGRRIAPAAGRPRRSAPRPAPPPSAPRDPGSSGSPAAAACHPASGCTPAAPAAADTSRFSVPPPVRPATASTPYASMSSNVWPSTPGAPPLARQRA